MVTIAVTLVVSAGVTGEGRALLLNREMTQPAAFDQVWRIEVVDFRAFDPSPCDWRARSKRGEKIEDMEGYCFSVLLAVTNLTDASLTLEASVLRLVDGCQERTYTPFGPLYDPIVEWLDTEDPRTVAAPFEPGKTDYAVLMFGDARIVAPSLARMVSLDGSFGLDVAPNFVPSLEDYCVASTPAP